MPYCEDVRNLHLNSKTLERIPERCKLLDNAVCQVTLSDFQSGDVGSIVGKIHYRHKYLLQGLDFTNGYPHNGGMHTLVVRDSIDKVAKWLNDVIKKFTTEDDIRYIVGIRELQQIRDYLLIQLQH